MDPAQKVELEALELVRPIDEATAAGDSDIQQFYRGATVFITGGTGFIGKQLIEKLFRSCEIEKAFILIRPKRDKSTKQRLEDMLNDPVFSPVHRMKPDFRSRLVYVEGDAADINLGICDADWNTIAEEVNVIFHMAATVRFDENIRTATLTNVRGTMEALKLGKACRKLRAFVHVSTAYCHATSTQVRRKVKEQFYESPVPPKTMLGLVETINSKTLENITTNLISDWPNTYTFTKAIAEELVRSEASDLPICVVRPSIVLNSYCEPVPGWLDISCLYGPTAICVSAGLGLLRVLYTRANIKPSFVPVDFVNNATIAAAWETAVTETKEAKIYNVSSTNCGLTFADFCKYFQSHKVRSLVTPRAIWYCYLIKTRSRVLYWFLNWILHYIPAFFIDAVIKVFHIEKPTELKSVVHIYSKFDKLSSVLKYFLTNDWDFDNTNLQSIWQKMSATDKTIYNFDMRSIDWNHNITIFWLGIRKYLIKDGLKDTNKSVTRQKWLKMANYAVFIMYLFIFWKILSWVWYAIISVLL